VLDGKHDAATSRLSAYTEAWATRERLQRAYDGFFSADVSG
jgi:hypothetical protein